jgi:hypothetical protein
MSVTVSVSKLLVKIDFIGRIEVTAAVNVKNGLFTYFASVFSVVAVMRIALTVYSF